MTTLNDFKTLRASVSAEVQAELYSLFSSDPDAARQRMVELAAEKGETLTVEQIREFLKQMDEDEEFDDIELDAVALAAVAGGWSRRSGCYATGALPLHASDAQVVIWSAASR